MTELQALAESRAALTRVTSDLAEAWKERDGLQDRLHDVQAELDDMRQAWSVLDEPGENIRGTHTAAEVAQMFRERLVSARAQLAAVTAERDEALLNCKRIDEAEFMRRIDERLAGREVSDVALTPLGNMLVGMRSRLASSQAAAERAAGEARAEAMNEVMPENIGLTRSLDELHDRLADCSSCCDGDTDAGGNELHEEKCAVGRSMAFIEGVLQAVSDGHKAWFAEHDARVRRAALEEADGAIRKAFDEWSEVDDRERVFLHHVQDYVRSLATPEPKPVGR